MDVVRRLEQAEYYVDLLFKMIDEEKCPFYSLIIKKKLVKRYWTYTKSLWNTERTICSGESRRASFVRCAVRSIWKALPHQLEVHETAEALAKQGLFKPLMNEFLSMIAKK